MDSLTSNTAFNIVAQGIKKRFVCLVGWLKNEPKGGNSEHV